MSEIKKEATVKEIVIIKQESILTLNPISNSTIDDRNEVGIGSKNSRLEQLGAGDDVKKIKVEESESMDDKEEDQEEVKTDLCRAYLERDEFSSERYKIEVKGLPKFYGYGELKKLLTNKLKLNPHKIKPPTTKSGNPCGFMFVNFRTEEERQAAIKAINGFKWKNTVLTAIPAKAAEDPLSRKRAFEKVEDGETGFSEQNETIEDAIRRVTTPWSNIPYNNQLSKKMEGIKKVVKEILKQIQQVNPLIGPDFEKTCLLEEIKPSPVTEKYRNKCEFTIGYNPVTSEKIVGFRVSSYKRGSVAIGPINHLIHLPTRMIEGAMAFQDYIRTSELNPYDTQTHFGCWKQLTVRTTEDGQLMLFVLYSSKQMKPEEVDKLKESLKEHFSNLKALEVRSFYLKLLESHGQKEKNKPELLFGEDCITETVLGLKFRISPEAFFQINTKATEVLYSTVASLLESNSETTVIDVCCGTGTIGICLADKCGQVLGLEMVASAVEDAKKNAELNGLSSEKCDFFTGKAEDIMEVVLSKAKYENIVAIVDPPRAGLHQRVLHMLRKCKKIKTIIYLSCDAKAATKNFVDLARPVSNHFKGGPFVPTQIIPVDLFPHCQHSEMIVLFKRLEGESEEETKA